MKRAFDILSSFFLLLFLIPLFIIISSMIYFSMGGPVLFKQKRIGRGNKVILLLKFRTMTNDVDDNGNLLPNELRITRLGRFLRKSSIDELPSLFNILKGDLSVVGPRPLLVEYLPFYKPEHAIRHSIRPGLTGLAQVNGRNSITWNKRLNFDVIYVNEQSFLFDMYIIYRTVLKVISQDGVEGESDISIIRLDKDKDYLGEKND